MTESLECPIAKSRREYLASVIVSIVVLALFVFSPKGIYLWPIALLILVPLFYFNRYANFYSNRVEIIYPLQRRKIIVEYQKLEKIRFTPAVLRAPPSITIWFDEKGKTKKYGFPINLHVGSSIVELVRSQYKKVKILGPWE